MVNYNIENGTVNFLPLADEVPTFSVANVRIGAHLEWDSNSNMSGQSAYRIVVQISPSETFASGVLTYNGTWDPQKGLSGASGNRTATTGALAPATLYYVRAYIQARNSSGTVASGFAAGPVEGSFWTDRPPNTPVPIEPVVDAEVSVSRSFRFSWEFSDPDTGDYQTAAYLFYRTAATPDDPAGTAVPVPLIPRTVNYYDFPAFQLVPNTEYEWCVATYDRANVVGPFSDWQPFFTIASTAAPTPLSPDDDVAVEVDAPVDLVWLFRDPNGETQYSAAVRYREVGTLIWTSTAFAFSAANFRTILPNTFVAGVHYEWQVWTENSAGSFSDWSESATFWGVVSPGSSDDTPPTFTAPQSSLGCGTYRVFVYDKGGMRARGEIKPLSALQWARNRDDISTTTLTTNGFDADCGELLAELRSWIHEIVVFRDNGHGWQRVWEGPVTRITYNRDNVEIEAKDVMAYVYRRVMRQGYNDSYRLVAGVQQGLHTVVERSVRIIQNALGYDNPNILGYLTPFHNEGDARQSRVVAGYSKSAWEEVDDMAATAGLDYTTLGRRIMLWDTHQPVGLLPEMRDGDFSDPLIVTEYGMQTATDFVVTNNNGIWGAAHRPHTFYGHVEMIASAYGEATGAPSEETLTPAAKAELQITLAEQAERNISARYPTPLIVRVPDNTTLSPDVELGINQLVPGVWIPLRAVGTLRKVTQMQKLDLVTVTWTEGEGEKINVTMSPAPGANNDPDSGDGDGEDDA